MSLVRWLVKDEMKTLNIQQVPVYKIKEVLEQ